MSARQIIKRLIPVSLFKTIEPLGHLLEAIIVNFLNGFPAKNLNVIGVTGTNGKTSTATLIHKMLQNSGYKTGLISTIEWGIGDDLSEQNEHYTNVPIRELMTRLKLMKKERVEWLVIEITSHALAQNRVWGIPISVAVMTNITHEHLDYHGTFEKYRDAKVKLFKLANKNKKGLRTGVINADDPNANYFSAAINFPLLYGLNDGEIKAKNIQLKPGVVKYQVSAGSDSYDIICHLPGSFNVYNSLAALTVGRAMGLSTKQIEEGISSLQSVKGRMTRINEGQEFDVIVDFAHTPDSFEKLFKDIKPVVKGRLIVMFGSPGRRDEGKRQIQGELAGKYADLVVLTEEDDRDTDGAKILGQIKAGAIKNGKQENKDLFLVPSRPEAIAYTLSLAKKGDTVLLLGKGHEKTIERVDGAHPWDEINAAHQSLKQILKQKT